MPLSPQSKKETRKTSRGKERRQEGRGKGTWVEKKRREV